MEVTKLKHWFASARQLPLLTAILPFIKFAA
jgi:hypothetical protein